MTDRLRRLHEALLIAEKAGNAFLAANLRAAIREEERLNNTPRHK
ncbi:MAG: hypothetical protein ACO3GP_01375 [Candidatus Limnocylindrus sp.]